MRKQFRNAVISYNNNDYNVTYSNNEESLWKKIAEIAYKNNFSSNMLIATNVDDKSVRQAIVEIEKEEKKNRSKYRLKLKEDTFYLKKSLYKEKKYRLINSEKDIRIKYDLLPNNLGPRTLSVGVITNNIGEEGLDRIEDGIVLHPFPSQLYWLNCYLKEFEGYKDYSGDRKPGLQLHVHIIVSRNDVTQTVRLSPLARSKGSFNELNGKKVMVGFEHMEWKSRCADRFISMYGYKATHKYYEDGREHTYHYVPGKNEAMSMAKSAILQKEFRNERKMLDVSYRMFRFMVNPKQALIAEAKRLVKDALTGKI